MSRQRLNVITVGIMLSIFLASVEGTIVSTAMPTIVGQLGGLSIFSWVFSVYMLASTTTVPIYGKLSDLYGRKLIYVISMSLFLVGSVLCGFAGNMEQLILFRAVQGLGAGGVLPLAFTIIGELFTLEERARIQGLFSGVWGVSSVIGPLIGGFFVDQISWQWVFYINVFPGLVAMGLVWFAWVERERKGTSRVSVDYLGAVLLTVGVLALLLGLNETGTALSWGLLALAAALFIALVAWERRVENPILPLPLFKDRLFTISILHGLFAGWAMFGSINYVPLFVQGVLGTSATQAGIALTPMSLSWTFASILTGRLLLKVGYRSLLQWGMVLLVVGALMMSRVDMQTNYWLIMFYLCLMGFGMGLSIPAFLIAVQSSVRREELGVATSTLQFSRSIGGTLGVSILGAILSARLSGYLLSAGVDPSTVSLDNLIEGVDQASAALTGPVREALAFAIASVFFAAFLISLAALAVVFFTPGGKVAQLQRERELDRPREVEPREVGPRKVEP